MVGKLCSIAITEQPCSSNLTTLDLRSNLRLPGSFCRPPVSAITCNYFLEIMSYLCKKDVFFYQIKR
ncbi:hypothetical protein TRIUR3_32492 [Triticum urartu]|uniref:Uncharacterized protein n=1 Tax=Triticum urartu TaxID=4572 RepID=M7ZCP1_TRIUA|nr:hypothetical protein TRIUR3_32492 [Triticum urartu]